MTTETSVFGGTTPSPSRPKTLDPSTYKNDFLKALEVNIQPSLNLNTGRVDNALVPVEEFNPGLFDKISILKDLRQSWEKDHEDGMPRHRVLFANKSNILIMGAGGVASWFLPQLIKMLYSCLAPYQEEVGNRGGSFFKVYIADGDKVETKNLLRQNFIPQDVGRNKAEVLAERYNDIYPNVEVIAIPHYLYSGGFIRQYAPDQMQAYRDSPLYVALSQLPSFNVVVNALDNEMSKHFIDYYLKNSWSGQYYFSAGCHEHGGTVTMFRHKLDYFTSYYKDETFKEDGGDIETFSCAELAEQAVEQTFDSNSVAANVLAVAFHNSLKDPFYDVKRIAFTSTGNMHCNVLEHDTRFIYVRYKAYLEEKTQEIEEYLLKRGYTFKSSKVAKEYQDFMKEHKKWVKWATVFPSLDVSFLGD